MDLFERVREIALQEHETGEFPSWLLAEVLSIADHRSRYADKGDLVEILIAQIGAFDPYAGTGCFDTSVGAETIRTTIRNIMS